MTLENWAANRWIEKLASDREEIERLLANADGHLDDYRKAVKSEMSADAQLSLAYDAIRASATAALRAAGYRSALAAGAWLFLVRPEAIADFEGQIRAVVSVHSAHGAVLQFGQERGDSFLRLLDGTRQFITRCHQTAGMTIGRQADMHVELERSV
ncbi:MAG TPA: hypothetical protein VMU71_00865 [Terracidiphilus sp.]|nr:hypothetical protein [Terracidiphilus sp.]